MEEKAVLQSKTKLPEEMRYLFWDVNFDELYFEDYKDFIAARILCFGDNNSLKYLAKKISKQFVLNLVHSNREIDEMTRNYWKAMYNEQ